MATDYPNEIRALRTTMASVREVVGLDRLATRIAALEAAAGAPDLWDDPENAQKVTSNLSRAIAERDRILEMDARIDDLEVLVELGTEEGDEATLAEAERELTSITKAVGESRFARCWPASTTSAAPSSPSARAPGASTRPISPTCCRGCMPAGPSGMATP